MSLIKCDECGKEVSNLAVYCPHCGVPISEPPVYYIHKTGPNKLAAAMLSIFLGSFGIHKFYTGRTGMGILYLLFFWTGFPTIAGFLEGIVYLSMTDDNFQKQYA